MFENLFTNVFGRPKSKSSSSGSRSSQVDANSIGQPSSIGSSSQMTGPFSMSAPQMPQPPNLPYPPAAPYPANSSPAAAAYYPSLPFSQPPDSGRPYNYPTGTMVRQVSPLDQVPFEAKLSLNNSTNLVSLDQLFREIKKAAEVVDRADAYLRSNQSDYDFKIEQNLIYH